MVLRFTKNSILLFIFILFTNIIFAQRNNGKAREYTLENFCASNEYIFLTADVKIIYDSSNILAATEITAKKSNIESFFKWCVGKMTDIDINYLNDEITKNILCDNLNNKILKNIKVLDVVFENASMITLSDIGSSNIVLGDYSNNTVNAPPSISDIYKAKPKALDWYKDLAELHMGTADNPPAALTIKISLGYKKNDNTTSQEIKMHDTDIRLLLFQFFREKHMAELEPRNENKLKIELRNAINDDILTNSKISDITFEKFDVLKP